MDLGRFGRRRLPVLTDPFDIVHVGDVARRAVLDETLCAGLLTEYRVFLHECLQTAGLVVAPNGWMIGVATEAGTDDELAVFLGTRTEEDLVELAPPDEGGVDFDELSYGIALDGGDVAFWLPTFGGALITPGPVASGRRLIEPLYARLALVVRTAASEVFVDEEIAGTVVESFWSVAGEHIELQDLAPTIGVRPLDRQITDWLAEHLGALTPVYGALELAPEARLVGVGDGHARVDLAARRHGGWVLVLVRRGEVGLTALAQIDRSLDVARDAIALGDDTVEGLLVAERASDELVEVLGDRADVLFADVASLLAP
jgi:hypothetical protein